MSRASLQRLERQLCAAVMVAITGSRARPPEAGRELWNIFQRLSATRSISAAGPNPIQPSELAAWCRLMNTPLAPQHIAIIFAMDQAWFEGLAAGVAPAGVKTLPPVSSHAISADLLDAILG